ncbi:MAG: DUF1731 domain-containing protein [Pirellulales bacterium]
MAVLPAPAFALRWMLGGMAEPLLLASCRAVPQRLEEVGFPFRFAMLKSVWSVSWADKNSTVTGFRVDSASVGFFSGELSHL